MAEGSALAEQLIYNLRSFLDHALRCDSVGPCPVCVAARQFLDGPEGVGPSQTDRAPSDITQSGRGFFGATNYVPVDTRWPESSVR